MNKRKWDFWKRLRDFCNKRMTAAWMEDGNCDSICPVCKRRESHGNIVWTDPLIDGTDYRECKTCGVEWKALFTPVGFIQIEPPTDSATGEDKRKNINLNT